ncbi:hypothetical protein [Streptomyces sp. NPDC020983]|uniref:hypothetical protein n=1 Tax=Streptomyces sp. NPDC020983 TaxID=3365106 RepID=UPI0037B7FBAD
MTAADLWALADRPAPPVIPGQTAIEVPARCACARSWGLHSRGCQRWTPGHELIAHPEPLFDLPPDAGRTT